MDFLSKIKNWIFKIAQNKGLLFYYKKQSYRAEYKVNIKNLSQDSFLGWVLLPIPNSYKNQEVAKQIVFSTEPNVRASEMKYRNQYAVWRLELEPYQRFDINFKFDVDVVPYRGMDMTKDEQSKDVYQKADRHVQSELAEIKKIANKIIKLQKSGYARIVNDYVVKNLHYGNPIKGLYSTEDAMRLDKVDCGGFNSFMAAIARACGLSARLIFGFWAGYEKNEMHAWLEIEKDGALVPADPSMEYLRKRGQTRKSGEFGFVGSDRIIFSEGSDYEIELDGEKHQIEILQHPVILPKDKGLKIKVETALETKKI